MFYNKGRTGRTDGWMYFIGIFMMMVGYFLGQMPYLWASRHYISKNNIMPEQADKFLSSNDFSIIGMPSNLGYALMITIFAFATAGLWVAVRYLHQKRWLDIVTAFEKVDWQRLLVSWLLWLILGGLVEVFYYLIDPSNYYFEVNWGTWTGLLLISLFYLPVQSSLEEYVFRGYLLQAFGLVCSRKYMPVVITAVLFALPHSFNPEVARYGLFPMFSYYIVAGLLLGIIVVMDDRLELALGVHAATNFFGAVVLGFEGSVLQTDTLFTQKTVNPWMMTLAIIIAGGLFLLACKRLYAWESFKKLNDPIQFNEA